jgi:hypothetical protein
MESNAIFSSDRMYRYALWRIWDNSKPTVMFIGLNPSFANESVDDPTMKRCIGFAKNWNYGGIYMTNLFAFCTTYPNDLRKAIDPIGVENDKWLKEIELKSSKVVFAWGVSGAFLKRNEKVINLFQNSYYIALSKMGHPRHPLYLSSDLELKRFIL